MTKQNTIELPDSDFFDLARVAQADGRKVKDLTYLLLAEGLRFFYCETPLAVKTLDSEFTLKEKEQLKKNKELEDSKSWSHLSHKQKEEKGYEYVCHYHHNDEFLDPLEEKIRQLALGEEVF